MTELQKRVVRGAFAGLAGAAAMKGSLYLWHAATEHEPRHGAFGLDDEADIESAQMLSLRIAKRKLRKSTAKAVGVGLHYGFGAATGAAYQVVAERRPEIRLGRGTAFGGVLWLVGDELAITLGRISQPQNRSFGSHAAALGAHLLFGSILDFAQPKKSERKETTA